MGDIVGTVESFEDFEPWNNEDTIE